MKRNIQISQPVTGIEEWEATKESILSGWITSGPKVNSFEKQFGELHQVETALATTSATTALHLAMVALNVGPGDEVIVPAFTWVATANVVLYCGATPVFVDIDLETFNMDPQRIKEKITSKTKAIIPVHLFGLCADMDAIKEAAPGIPLVEDAACASGAFYKGAAAGSLGDMGCFSFHPRKAITTGEGGMLTTNNKEYGELIGKLRNHGAEISEEQRHHGPRPYILPDFNLLGFNYRMTDIQASIGIVQLGKMNALIEERKRWADYYSSELDDIDWIQTPSVPEGSTHGWQSYVTLIDEEKSPISRNAIMELLQEKGISTRPGTHAVHMLNYYSDLFNLSPDDFPNAKAANDRTIAIPLHNRMSKDDYEYIVDVIKNIS